MSGMNLLLQDASVLRLVQIALAEDVGEGDVTSEALIDESAFGTAHIMMKSSGVVAGIPLFELVARQVDPDLSCDWHLAEGDWVDAPALLGRLLGPMRSILTAERTALNFMQRIAGVATLTRSYMEEVAGTRAQVIDTRKTIPGWRSLDKYAVTVGGGKNHRMGLYDMVMIKDNHIAAHGSITKAVAEVRRALHEWGRPLIKVEVETQSLDDVRETLACDGVDRIMFDNFPLPMLHTGVALVAGRVETEASGGITLNTIRAVAESGVDFISVGALTHSAIAVDISLDVISQPTATTP